MENDDLQREIQRLQAENIGLRLKVQDLDALLGKVKRNFEQIYGLYKDQSGVNSRALSLLESYAELPGINLLGKLDRKMTVFFPQIIERVKRNRERVRRDNIKIVDGSLLDGPNNTELDIRRIY